MTIEVRREWLVGLLAACLAGLLVGLGWQASPRDVLGRPVLLLPEVRAVEAFRRQAAGWVQAWQALEARLEASLTVPEADLLAKSQAAHADLDSALALAQRVDASEAPPAMTGLHDQVATTAQAFTTAFLSVNQWISAPSKANRLAAQAAYEQAQAALADLEANAWVRASQAVDEDE